MPLPDEFDRLARRHLGRQIGLLYRDAADTADHAAGGEQETELPGRVLGDHAQALRCHREIGELSEVVRTVGLGHGTLRVKDFRPLLGFADLHGNYRSADLFPLFAQRAMDPRRPDYHRYIERLGLEGEPGPWEQIARSQGRRQGDTLQLLPEPTVSGDELSCRFLVHGIRHVHEEPRVLAGREIHVTREEVEAALARLAPGEKLALTDEPDNPANSLAIMVLGSDVPIGWVPDLLVEDVHRLMRRADVTVSVEHVNGPDAPWHLRLLARLRAVPAGDFRFFTGKRWEPLATEPAQ